MFGVVVSLTLKPKVFSSFMPLMQSNAKVSLEEEGCLQFDIATDPLRPEEVFLYELYKDQAAFDQHLASDHFKHFDQATAEMIESKVVQTYSEVSQ